MSEHPTPLSCGPMAAASQLPNSACAIGPPLQWPGVKGERSLPGRHFVRDYYASDYPISTTRRSSMGKTMPWHNAAARPTSWLVPGLLTQHKVHSYSMHIIFHDKTGTLTLNRLTVDRNLVEVFSKNMDKDLVVLLAARASRLENQDAIDAAIINMLADPKEARANIKEVHFLPFNPVDKRTAITYIDSDEPKGRNFKGELRPPLGGLHTAACLCKSMWLTFS
ncbi:hypothetical protein GOBAR_DD31245 [Gossypium barbadense]|nr:hypothetical protein GOBAR_DD31245 [Gossypium barbadense]